jgi:hypothetical protein
MDAVTYPDIDVRDLIRTRFVPLKLDLSNPEQAVKARALVPLWTPTIVVTDGRGREVHREVGYLPPWDFLPMLGLARAKGLFATARGVEAVQTLDEAIGRDPRGDLMPQLLYWRGAIGYSVSHDHSDLAEHWGRLQREFPDTTWSTRTSFFEPA